jgi:hypothetical protein
MIGLLSVNVAYGLDRDDVREPLMFVIRRLLSE